MGEQAKDPPSDDKFAAAKRELERIEEQQARVAQERLLALYEAVIKYTRELGPRGEAFEVVDGGPHGPIVIKRGEAVQYKKLKAKIDRKQDKPEDIHECVMPCVVFPDPDTFNKIVHQRPHLLTKCFDAAIVLFGAWEDKSLGK